MHYKELGNFVDTAKLICAAFPDRARLVIGGLERALQPAQDEMMCALKDEATRVCVCARARACVRACVRACA